MPSLSYHFEVPLLSYEDRDTAYVSGTAEIEFDRQANWWIVGIALDADERRTQEPARINLYRQVDVGRSVWWQHVEAALQRWRHEDIVDRIVDETDGECAPPDLYAHDRATYFSRAR